METSFTIRAATVADALGIAEVHVRTWQDTYVGHMPPEFLAGLSVVRREEMWRGVLGPTADAEEIPRVWVAVGPSGQPIGESTEDGVAEGNVAGREARNPVRRSSGGEEVLGFVCLSRTVAARTADRRRASSSAREAGSAAFPLAEVKALYVRPGAQSAGLGARLLDEALAHARQGGAGGARLDVLAGNDGARRFYERHGFLCTGTSLERIADGVEVLHAHYEVRWDPVEPRGADADHAGRGEGADDDGTAGPAGRGRAADSGDRA